MNRKELSQLYFLNKEIEREKKRMVELETAQIDNSAEISGISYLTIANRSIIGIQIEMCKASIEIKTKASTEGYNRVNKYISSIDNSLMRKILTLRFVDGLPWNQVAYSIGGGNTADSVRMLCNRFLRKK